MKNLFKLFALVVIVAASATACQEADNELDASTTLREGAVLYASTSSDSSTRISFTDNDTEGIALEWEQNDEFTVTDSDGVKYIFTCTDPSTGEFTSSEYVVLNEGETYTATYGSTEQLYTQNGDDITKLDAACYMTASFEYSSNLKFYFQHQMAIITFKFESAETTPSKLIFKNGDEEYTVNYTSIEPEEGVYTSHIMINPCEQSERLLSFTLYDSDGEDYYTRSVLTSKAYLAGVRYNASIDSIDEYFIPQIHINTENGESITSKDYYLSATIRIIDEDESLSLSSTDVSIKGRGNSTWNMPKKPYRLKFDSKQSLGGFPSDKSWVLLANYTDKSAFRTSLAFALSELTNLEYTPRWKFYDLYLNDTFQGSYLLSEHKKISTDRVNVGDDGFLLEVDQLSRVEDGDVYFYTNKILLNIKDSDDVEYESDEYYWIKDYMTEAETVLYSDDFKDPDNGYAKYFNVESFADWYLVNEIAKNNDAIFFSSCMMGVTRAGVISMGPVWDFDIGFGNCYYNYETTGFHIKNAAWISRLFQDPAFVEIVKERYEVIKNNLDGIYELIDTYEAYLTVSQYANNDVWGTLGIYVWPNYVWYDTYEEEVAYLKDWLTTRLEWLDVALYEL